MAQFGWVRSTRYSTEQLDAAVQAERAALLARLKHLVARLVHDDYAEVVAGDDELAGCLAPIVEHLRDKNFGTLTTIADVWVAQTAPLIAVARMKADMQELGGRTQSIASAINELLASIGEIGRATDEVAREATEVHDRVGNSSTAAEEAVSCIGKSAAAVTELEDKVYALNGSIEQIASIVKAIEDIASQTNLLALNATIEAARAGEAGKGFAVVAGEVKTLSNQTAKATEDIRQRIAGLQGSMGDIVSAMKASGATVEAGTIAVRQAGESIKTINVCVEEVSRNVSTIAGVIQEQMTATTEVDSSVNATAAMSGDALATIERLAHAVDRVSEVVQPRLQDLSKHSNDRTLVQLARSDHASFKKRVIDTLVGRGKTKDSDLPDHHGCRFGKWYDSLSDATLKNSADYRRIQEPHLRVHACGKEALAKFQAGDFAAAVAAADQMEKASEEVFSALDEMARLLAARTPLAKAG
jgi:methyl-accepting chemotaxis protein